MFTSPFQYRHVLSTTYILLCVALLRFSTPAVAAPPQTEAVRVYINASVPSQQLSDAVLRSIFSMRLTLWPDGSQIRVVVLNDAHPVHRQFSKSVLGIFPYQLRQMWDRGVFSGTGEAPIEVPTEQDMLETLATTPGAIGYLLQPSTTEGIELVERP